MTTLIGNDEVSPGRWAVPVVTKADIRHIVSLWTGVPVHELSTDETDKLLRMEEVLATLDHLGVDPVGDFFIS